MKLRILVVDDDEDLLFLAEKLLHVPDEELELVTATTAQAAVQLLDESDLDAVICDYYLGPGQMNGLEILEWVREEEIDIPFIIFTGHSREEIAIKALNLGADYYIEKSDDLEGLFTEIGYHIRKVVRSKRTEEALFESEQRYRTLVQSLNDLIFVVDSENRFSQYHSLSRDELDEPPDQFIGKLISEVLPDTVIEKYSSLEKEVRASGKRQSFDYELIVNGEKKWFNADLDLHEDKESIVVTVADITKRKQAEIDLRVAEREWRNTFDSIPDLVSVLNSNFEIIKANRTMADFVGLPPEELIGKKCFELMHRTSEPFPECPHLETIKTGLPTSKEICDPCIGNPYLVTTSPIQDEHGEQVGVVHIAKDISDRLEAERAIRESESQFRAIFEEAGVGMALVIDGQILEANSALSKFLGYDANEMKELTINEITHPDDRGKDGIALRDLIASDEESYNLEKRYIRKDGETVWGKLTVSLIRGPEGEQHYSIGMVEDISEMKRAEVERLESESKFRLIFDHAPIGISHTNMKGELYLVNDALHKMLGYSLDEFKSMTVEELTHPDDWKIELGLNQELVSRSRDSYTFEKRYFHKDGQIIWGRLNVSVKRDDEGKPDVIIGMVEDITERKRSEELLGESERKFRTIFERARIGMTIVGIDDQIIDANSAFQELLGYHIDELRKMKIAEFTYHDDAIIDARLFKEVMDGKRESYQMEKRYICKDGVLVWANLTVSVVKDENNEITFIVGMIEDITARKEAESALRESEERYRLLFDNLSDGLFITNSEGIITMCSPQGALLFGSTPDEIVGNHFSTSVHPDDRERLIREFQMGFENKATQPGGHEVRGMKPDGSEFFYHITNTLLIEDDKPAGYQSLIRDITELKQIEAALRESENRFRQIVESTPMGIHMYELNDKDELIFVGANPAADKLLGLDNCQFIGKTLTEAFPSATGTVLPEKYKEVALEGGIWSTEQIDYEDELISGAFEVHAYQTAPRKMVASFLEITERKIAEQTLANSQENLQSVFNTIDDFLFIVGLDGKFLTTNKAVSEALGYTEEELHGLEIIDVHPPDQREEAADILRQMMEHKTTSCNVPVMAKDGTIIPVETRITHGKWSGEDVIFGVSRDITQRKHMQVDLEESEKRAQQYLDIVCSMILTLDSEGIVTNINRKGSEILGYDADEVIGLKWIDNFIPHRFRTEIQEVHSKIISGRINEVEEYENPVLTKSGEEILLEWRNAVLMDDDGNIYGAISSAVDITDISIAEKQMRSEKEFTDTALNSQRDTFFVFDPSNGKAIRWNRVFQEITEYSEEEIASMKAPDSYYDSIDLERATNATKNLLKEGRATIELNLITKSGKRIPFEYEASLMKINNDKEYIVSVGRDITERKHAEEAIDSQLEFLESVLESLSHPFYVIDANDYTIRLANKVARIGDLNENPTCHYVTHRSEEPCHLSNHPCPLKEVKKTKKPVMVEHQHYDDEGKIRDMEIHAHPIFDDEGNVTQMIEYSLDVTDLKKTLRALEEGEKRFRMLYENAPLGYQTLDYEGNIIDINSAWLEATGYSRDDVVGHYFGDFLSEDSDQLFRESFPIFKRSGEMSDIEYEMIRKDGSQLVGRFSGRTTKDKSGEFKQTACIFQDVTDWKVSDALLRSQKEELSELAHIMSHDLGNKMKNIRSLIMLLKRDHNEEVLERIDNLAQQTSELLQSSAKLADLGLVVERGEIVDLNHVVREIASTVIPDNIVFEMDELPKVKGDSQRITQIIQNLLANAVEHGHPNLIEVRTVTSRAGMSLKVMNDGEIIPNEIKDKIFQRGFTTIRLGRGLGLAIVKKLVEAHGWTIQIEPTEKTVFKITVPKSSIQN